MNGNSLKQALVVILILLGTQSSIQAETYSKVRVIDGPIIEYPSHWEIVDDSIIKDRTRAAKELVEQSGYKSSGFQKRNRVVIESRPIPISAQIRASIVTPQEYTQDDLRKATHAELELLKQSHLDLFQKIYKNSPIKIASFDDIKIDSVSGTLALEIRYTRFTDSDPTIWQVEQIKIPFKDKILSLTVSCRASEMTKIQPIFNHVKNTIKFSK